MPEDSVEIIQAIRRLAVTHIQRARIELEILPSVLQQVTHQSHYDPKPRLVEIFESEKLFNHFFNRKKLLAIVSTRTMDDSEIQTRIDLEVALTRDANSTPLFFTYRAAMITALGTAIVAYHKAYPSRDASSARAEEVPLKKPSVLTTDNTSTDPIRQKLSEAGKKSAAQRFKPERDKQIAEDFKKLKASDTSHQQPIAVLAEKYKPLSQERIRQILRKAGIPLR